VTTDDSQLPPPASASDIGTPPPGIQRLLSHGVVDPPIGALVWTLVEGGVPVLVCGPAEEGDLQPIADALGETAPVRTLADGRSVKPARILRAGSLKEAFEILAGEPFNLSDDALRDLGLVVVLRDGRADAVHYVRPVERDGEGHLQHRPPAVLATWNADRQSFDQFAWAMAPELGARVGRTQAEFEELVAARAHALGQAQTGVVH
jgi:hypothetical protein